MYIFQHKGQVFGPMALSQEIDVRYEVHPYYERLVLCHNIEDRYSGLEYTDNDLVTFVEYVQKWLNDNTEGMLAINIKEDGLAPYIKRDVDKIGLPYDRFFCFDMAQKEVQHYQQFGLPIATSVSSYGVDYPCGDSLLFDWFPELPVSYGALYHYCFAGNLYDTMFLGDEKFIAISPELHDSDFNGKELRKFWKWCEEKGFYGLITDYPEKAEVFFNGNEADSR